MNYLSTTESLTGGTAGQGTPHVIETKTGPVALLYWRGQNSTAVSSPTVTSSPDVLLDEAHRLHYLPDPNIDSSDDGGGHGGSVTLDDGATPVMTSVARPKARTSTSVLRRTYRARFHGLRWRRCPSHGDGHGGDAPAS